MRITYEVEVSKWQDEVEIDDEELAECETEEEKEELIREYIQDDFEQNISWSEVSRESKE